MEPSPAEREKKNQNIYCSVFFAAPSGTSSTNPTEALPFRRPMLILHAVIYFRLRSGLYLKRGNPSSMSYKRGTI
jgi:hypothetical protein